MEFSCQVGLSVKAMRMLKLCQVPAKKLYRTRRAERLPYIVADAPAPVQSLYPIAYIIVVEVSEIRREGITTVGSPQAEICPPSKTCVARRPLVLSRVALTKDIEPIKRGTLIAAPVPIMVIARLTSQSPAVSDMLVKFV